MSAYFGALGSFSQTLGSTLTGSVRASQFYANDAEVRIRSRRAARCGQYSRFRVFAAHRGGQQESAVVPSLPEAAQADDGRRRAALLRSVCAARRLGEPRVHAGRGADTHRRRRRAAGRRLRLGDQSRVQRAMDRSDAERGKAFRRIRQRRRVRRASVHAHQLQRQVQRHVDRGARARPRDAQLSFEQRAAIPSRRLSDVRGRGRVAVQRGSAARIHPEAGEGRRMRGSRFSATTSRR